MWNLSWLSRGSGQLVNGERKRLDVYLEAQDYFNWRSSRNSVSVSLELSNPEGFLHHRCNPAPPKTFTTRRGALVLYSEDLALQPWQRQRIIKWRHRARLQLCTLQDLVRAVLAYGQREGGSGLKRVEPNLHFLIGHSDQPGDRKIRPGYSAKRYLACLAETCDAPHRLRGSESGSDLNQPAPTSLITFLKQQTKCDLSKVPSPYRTLPYLPAAHWYPSTPCLEEGEDEAIPDAGGLCSVTDDAETGMQPDYSYRPGTRESRVDTESGPDCEDPRESALYVLIALEPGELEQVTAEAQEVQGTQHVLDRPPSSSLTGAWPLGENVPDQRSNTLGQPTIDSSQLCSRRSLVTYYGGPLVGTRRGTTVSVKTSPSDQSGCRQHTEPPASLNGHQRLPPIGSEIGTGLQPMEGQGSGELGEWKLPSIRRTSMAAARHAGRQRGGAKPDATQLKQGLVLPPLADIKRRKQGWEDVREEGAENKGKSEAPGPMETSRMEGLDQAAQKNGDHPISAEPRLGQIERNVGILPAISSQTESEGRTVRFITVEIDRDRDLLEGIKGESEILEPTESSRMDGLDQAARINGDHPISTEQGANRDGGNVGIFPETEMERRAIRFITIRIEENGNLTEGKSAIPDTTETSRMEGLDQGARISEDGPISAEHGVSKDGGNVGVFPEISGQPELEGRTVGFIGIRIEEDGDLVKGDAGQRRKPRPVLQVLPPIHGTTGPVKQRNQAGLRHKIRRNKNSSPGAVRGTVPKELKELHKDTAAGSLLMAPDGQVVQLSWLGSVQIPSGSFPTNAPRQQEHIPPERNVDRKKAGRAVKQGLEGHMPVDGDLTDKRAGADTEQELEGEPDNGTARGSKDGSNRRAKVKGRGRDAAGDPAEMELDEDGNLRQPYCESPRSNPSSVYDPEHEGEVVQRMKRPSHAMADTTPVAGGEGVFERTAMRSQGILGQMLMTRRLECGTKSTRAALGSERRNKGTKGGKERKIPTGIRMLRTATLRLAALKGREAH
ncbi:uncharacterized protein LOC144503431 [Mustelus asterias]